MLSNRGGRVSCFSGSLLSLFPELTWEIKGPNLLTGNRWTEMPILLMLVSNQCQESQTVSKTTEEKGDSSLWNHEHPTSGSFRENRAAGGGGTSKQGKPWLCHFMTWPLPKQLSPLAKQRISKNSTYQGRRRDDWCNPVGPGTSKSTTELLASSHSVLPLLTSLAPLALLPANAPNTNPHTRWPAICSLQDCQVLLEKVSQLYHRAC